jgi:hypothetical protein
MCDFAGETAMLGYPQSKFRWFTYNHFLSVPRVFQRVVTYQAVLTNSCFSGELLDLKTGECSANSHNPTHNPKQLITTFVGVVLLSVKKMI